MDTSIILFSRITSLILSGGLSSREGFSQSSCRIVAIAMAKSKQSGAAAIDSTI